MQWIINLRFSGTNWYWFGNAFKLLIPCQSTIIIIRSSLIPIQAALSLATCLLEDNLVTDICVLLSGLMHCLLHTSGFSALDQFYIYISSAPDSWHHHRVDSLCYVWIVQTCNILLYTKKTVNLLAFRTMHHSSLSVFRDHKTPNGVTKHRESIEPESRQVAFSSFR